MIRMVTTMIRTEREYRTFKINTEKRELAEGEQKDYKVRGYASTFDVYTLWKDPDTGNEYREQIDPDAFSDADMSDVIFQYNHSGMVYARVKNGSLTLSVDSRGLYIEADLGLTTQSRELFEAIDSGLVDQMSFAFIVAEDEYDKKTRTRHIRRFSKIYDVSAVDIPANPNTDISAVSARNFLDGVIEAEKAERLEEQRQVDIARARYRFMEV